MHGSIAGVGFSTGNRVVIGHWNDSPIGPFSDVMWAEPDGWRTLFVATMAAKSFVTAIYDFETVHVVPELRVDESADRIHVAWNEAELSLRLGRAVPFPPRNAWLSRRIERPIARMTMGVLTHGVSPSGVEEEYRARRIHRIKSGWGVAAGRDLGTIGPPRPACGFGFSEPPPFPSLTRLETRMLDPSGHLDKVFALLNAEARGLPSPGGESGR